MAFPRSLGGNTTKTTDNVDGITRAAPNPITPRAKMTSVDESAKNAVHADAVPTISNPICKAPFRPNRSPNAPITRRVPPNTSAYASIIHCNSELSAPRLVDRFGSATFSVTLFNITMTRLKLITPRINHRLLGYWDSKSSMVLPNE